MRGGGAGRTPASLNPLFLPKQRTRVQVLHNSIRSFSRRTPLLVLTEILLNYQAVCVSKAVEHLHSNNVYYSRLLTPCIECRSLVILLTFKLFRPIAYKNVVDTLLPPHNTKVGTSLVVIFF